ncbi:unnamed protein product [Choristocarpus tenellus]
MKSVVHDGFLAFCEWNCTTCGRRTSTTKCQVAAHSKLMVRTRGMARTLPVILTVYVFLLGVCMTQASPTGWRRWTSMLQLPPDDSPHFKLSQQGVRISRGTDVASGNGKTGERSWSHRRRAADAAYISKECEKRGKNVLVDNSETDLISLVDGKERKGLLVSYSKGWAMVKTLVRPGPRPSTVGPSPSVNQAGSQTGATKISRSYLQWPSSNEPVHELARCRSSTDVAENCLTSDDLPRKESPKSARESVPSKDKLQATTASARVVAGASLTFSEAMFAGAISRSIAQTCMQPANVVKTLLQGRGTSKQLSKLSFRLLTRGAGAQFLLSLPHGALNFATLEAVRGCSARAFPEGGREKAGPLLDFFSSAVATFMCSSVSTPQMVLTDSEQ